MKAFSKQHAWFALFVLVVFALGLGSGLTIARFAGPGGPWRQGPPAFGGPPRLPGPPLKRLTRELDLTSEQQKQLEAVFQSAGKRFEEFRGRNRDEFEGLRRQLTEDILRVLTPEQQVRFRALVPRPPGRGDELPMGGPGGAPPGGPPPGPGR
jgi:hypothetical protein